MDPKQKARVQTRESLEQEAQSCRLCDELDNMEMVQCDACDVWFHFACVNVDETIADRPWSCQTCTAPDQRGTNQENNATAAVPTNDVEEQGELDRSNSASMNDSTLSQNHRKLAIIRQLQELMLQETRLMDALGNVEPATNSHETPRRPVPPMISRIEDRSSLQTPNPPPAQPDNNNNLGNREQPGARQIQHFLARQTMKLELPKFSGRYEEWPNFFAMYSHTTEQCLLSDAENIHRLSAALRGEARRWVESQLTDPRNVQSIMEDLELRYGRPEALLQVQLSRLRKEAAPKADKLESIFQYAMLVKNVHAALEATKSEAHMTNPLLLNEMVTRLPSEYKLKWAETIILKDKVDIGTFSEWLSSIAKKICTVLPFVNETKSANKDDKHVVGHHAETNSSSSDGCLACKGTCTRLINCKKFREQALAQRWDIVKSHKLCRICLKDHESQKCDEAKKCGINGCTRLHNQLLHNPKNVDQNKPSSSAHVGQINHHEIVETLYRIMPVTLQNGKEKIETYIFCDGGSSTTLMEECLAEVLRLKGTYNPLTLKWTDGSHRNEENSQIVTFTITGAGNKMKNHVISARTVASLDLPVQSIDMEQMKQKFPYLQDVTMKSYDRARPRILLGLDNWHLCNPSKTLEGGKNQPCAAFTKLGWGLCGLTSEPSNKTAAAASHYHVCECQQEDVRLEEMVRQNFKLEAMGVTQNIEHTLTPAEKRARQIMEATTKFTNGRYEVGLLWRQDPSLLQLPDSKPMAMRRLICLEKKLLTNQALLDNFRLQIDQYLQKGYIRETAPEELTVNTPITWYLPTFVIQNPNKPGKLRIVWDAAAPTNGVSLNSVLLTGEDLLCSLLDVLLRFRVGKYAITGDIQEMFHQIKVRKEDQPAQRFLWRNCDQQATPKIYTMQVLTFGSSCSPYQSQYVMKLNAERYAMQSNLRAIQSITNNTYVDDLLDSESSLANIIDLAKKVKEIHQGGGFKIRNWRSNSPEVVAAMDETDNQTAPYEFNGSGSVEKVLGIFWRTEDDTITYSTRFNKASKDILNGNKRPTKRETLRTLMSLFDPAGWLAHFLIGLKILLQELWQKKVDWDAPMPNSTFIRWQKWIKQLPEIERIRIPRTYCTSEISKCAVEMHVFVDASNVSFAAAAYLRFKSANNQVEMSLIAAKNKVGPLKITSVPRLELMAAVLGARLSHTIIRALTNVEINKVFYWSDSKTTLRWIETERKLNQFVAFRVGEIRELTNISNWRYVPSDQNAADLATKWHDKVDLSPGSMWYAGPEFLKSAEETWFIDDGDVPQEFYNEVGKEETVGFQCEVEQVIDFQRFSTWQKLLRSTAFMLRFFGNMKNEKLVDAISKRKPQRKLIKKLPPSEYPTSRELREAEKWLILKAQDDYEQERQLLNARQRLPKKSQLRALSPFVDKGGIVRMKGRLALAGFCNYDTKNPILLPKTHRITQLIVKYYHEKTAHQFRDTVINQIRLRFHISNLRVLVNKVQRECGVCKILKAKATCPQMAPLPEARLGYSCAPFTYTGIDLFGPMTVTIRRRPDKRWGVIFTCMTIRAVHIELTSTLSTDGFIMAFRNFTSRRGEPREIFCDRGTNFVGAEKVLRKNLPSIEFNEVANRTTTNDLTWNFNPPASPHMGGAWERLIRSVKSALYVMIPEHHTPTPELLHSSLIEVERIINSRPLTQIPLDGPEEEALTPMHFLLGSACGRKVLGTPTDDNSALKFYWQKSQQYAQRFWRKWLITYLPTLNKRGKWYDETQNLKVGDVVIVLNEADKKRNWPKGIIIAVKQSSDGHVRSATVRTTDGIYDRPAVKLARLDLTSS